MDSCEDILSKLKFIGKIRSKERINVRNLCLQKDNLWTKIYRFVSQETREDTLQFLNRVIKGAFQILSVRLKKTDEKNRNLCSTIRTDLISALEGLQNIKITYEPDIAFCCKKDVLIQYVNRYLTSGQINIELKDIDNFEDDS